MGPVKNTGQIASQITWVYTGDLEAACKFYGELIGLELARDEGGARIYRTGENAFIGVCTAFEDRVVQPEGSMISLVTDDVDGWYEKLLSRGVKIDAPPHRLEQFGIYTFFTKDPNGYVIEFQQFI